MSGAEIKLLCPECGERFETIVIAGKVRHEGRNQCQCPACGSRIVVDLYVYKGDATNQ